MQKQATDNEQEKKWKMHVMQSVCVCVDFAFCGFNVHMKDAKPSSHGVCSSSSSEFRWVYRQRTIELWNYNASGSCAHNGWFLWKRVHTVQLNAMIQFSFCSTEFLHSLVLSLLLILLLRWLCLFHKHHFFLLQKFNLLLHIFHNLQVSERTRAHIHCCSVGSISWISIKCYCYWCEKANICLCNSFSLACQISETIFIYEF